MEALAQAHAYAIALQSTSTYLHAPYQQHKPAGTKHCIIQVNCAHTIDKCRTIKQFVWEHARGPAPPAPAPAPKPPPRFTGASNDQVMYLQQTMMRRVDALEAHCTRSAQDARTHSPPCYSNSPPHWPKHDACSRHHPPGVQGYGLTPTP